jgi:hypothetical protein
MVHGVASLVSLQSSLAALAIYFYGLTVLQGMCYKVPDPRSQDGDRQRRYKGTWIRTP